MIIIISSLIVLVLGIYAWRATSSKPTMLNLLVSSAFLLIAAYYVAHNRPSDMNWIPSFLATMLCAGRALGFLMRSRKEPELIRPAILVSAATVVAAVGAAAAFSSVH